MVIGGVMLNWFESISKSWHRRHCSPTFGQIMEFANRISDDEPRALVDLVKALLRPLQAMHLVDAIRKPQHQTLEYLSHLHFFINKPSTEAASLIWKLPSINPEHFRVRLWSDVALPTPWSRERYASALMHVGSGKRCGEWRQDDNHLLHLMLPWGISFVNGGNHSIAAGMNHRG